MKLKVKIDRKVLLTKDGKFATGKEYLEDIFHSFSLGVKEKRFHFYHGIGSHTYPLEVNKKGLFISYKCESWDYKEKKIYLKSFNVEAYSVPEQFVKIQKR